MVRIISLAANFLALLVSTEACQGYFQCKYTDGSHCCVSFDLPNNFLSFTRGTDTHSRIGYLQ